MKKGILMLIFSLTFLTACTTDTSPVNAREYEETEEEYYARQDMKELMKEEKPENEYQDEEITEPYRITYNGKEYKTNIIDYNSKPEKGKITAKGTLNTQDNKSTYVVIDNNAFDGLTEGNTITITDENKNTRDYEVYERDLQNLKEPDMDSIIKYSQKPNNKEELYIQTHFKQNHDYVNIYKARVKE